MADTVDFVGGMKLSPTEISALDRYVELIEKASKNRMEFINSDAVAFTPGALLAVAVARFAYQVYRDYGKVALTPEDLQTQFADIARELADLEERGPDALSLDIYARIRRDLVAAKRSRAR